jgi:periplasmic copper chaperone A
LRYAAFAAVLLGAGCNNQPVERVTDASVRLPAVAGNPGAAYFTLHGGPANNRLVEVSSPQAIRAEMHDTKTEGGMMKMTPIESGVEVPAGGRVTFKTGGKHVMLFDVNPKVTPGDTVELTLTYANGRMIEVDAKAEAPGGGADHAH